MDRPPDTADPAADGLAADTPPEIALRRILAECRADLLAYRAVVLASRRPIGIHQTRVALRRMRAALGLFRDAMGSAEGQRDTRALAAEAKWLAAACAPARDLHVFLTETVEDPPPLVRRIANRLLGAHFERARSALAGARFDGFASRLAAFIEQPPAPAAGRLDDFGRRVLERRHEQVVRRARKLERLDDERLHRLRISLKKLRYAAEFLRPAFASQAAKPYIQATTHLQGALGTLNDRTVAGQVIADIAAAARPTEDVGRLLRKLAEQAASGGKDRRQRLQRAWKSFKKAERFWRAPLAPPAPFDGGAHGTAEAATEQQDEQA